MYVDRNDIEDSQIVMLTEEKELADLFGSFQMSGRVCFCILLMVRHFMLWLDNYWSI